MFALDGKKALVTGASGAIGGAIAAALYAQGAAVALTDKTGASVLAEEAAALGANAYAVAADLSDPESLADLVSGAQEALGGLDILVNNAGLTLDTLALRMKDEDWDTVLRINLTAAFKLSRSALRPMMKQRWGRIVNIASIVGFTGNPGQANYAASKAGLVGMAKSLAQEVATRGITVNCVAPGFIESPMTNSLSDEQRTRIAASVPAGHIGSPADVAACVTFLASDEAAYVTGQTLHVNGGMAMF